MQHHNQVDWLLLKMNIPIEIIIIIVLFLMMMIWAYWKRLTDDLNKGKFNPDNDKSRKGEEERRRKLTEDELGRAVETKQGEQSVSPSTTDDAPRPSKPKGRELLPATNSDKPVGDTDSLGTPSVSLGKLKLGFSNPFRRRK